MAITKQLFGRSGHMSSRTIFGAASLSHVTQQDADQTLQVLLQYGVNHIDVASSYGDAELRIAPWLTQYRSQFYVATKTDARTAQEAKEDLHRSLERMRIDYVDLWQSSSARWRDRCCHRGQKAGLDTCCRCNRPWLADCRHAQAQPRTLRL